MSAVAELCIVLTVSSKCKWSWASIRQSIDGTNDEKQGTIKRSSVHVSVHIEGDDGLVDGPVVVK